MMTAAFALALLALVDVAAGRSRRQKLLVLMAAVVLYGPFLAAWLSLTCASAGLERLLRSAAEPGRLGLLGPPVVLVAGVLFLLWRKRAPRFLWAWTGRPALVPRRQRLIVQATLLGLWMIGGNLLASYRQHQMEQTWTRMLGSLDVRERFPKRDTSEAGRRLAELGAPLGFEMPGLGGLVSEAARSLAQQVQPAIANFVVDVSRRPHDEIGRTPTEIRAFLAIHGGEIEAIERHLIANAGRLEWEWNLQAVYTPSFLGVRHLHALLLAAALDDLRSRHVEPALETLESAWHLTASCRSRPDLIGPLVAMSQDERLMGVLRMVPGPVSSLWIERLRSLDYRRTLLDSLRVASFGEQESALHQRATLRFVRAANLFGDVSDYEDYRRLLDAELAWAGTRFFRYVQGPLERPFMRLCAAERSRITLRNVEALETEDGCGSDFLSRETPDLEPQSVCRFLYGGESLSYTRLWRSAAGLRIQAELTEWVLKARAARAGAGHDAWPAELEGPAGACREGRFLYRVLENGEASLRPSGDLLGEEASVVPSEFTLRQPARRTQ
jgi:hypothetical protein